MRQWVVTCDRCGKEIQGDPMGLFLCMTDRDIPGVSVGDTDHSYDICDDCMAEVIKFMEHGRMGTTLQKADNPDDISIGDTMLPVPPEEKDNKAPETGQQSDMLQKKKKARRPWQAAGVKECRLEHR